MPLGNEAICVLQEFRGLGFRGRNNWNRALGSCIV